MRQKASSRSAQQPTSVLGSALPRAWRTIQFLVRLIVPISFVVGVLRWTGLLESIGRVFAPAMALFHLPGSAAIALLSGWLAGIYALVGAMAVLPLTPAEVTIICAMALVSHNLIVECTVQDRAGTPWWWMLLVRMIGSAIIGLIVASSVTWLQSIHAPALWFRFVPPTPPSALPVHGTFIEFLNGWARQAVRLVVKLVVIVTLLMVATEWIRARGHMARLEQACRPVLHFFGLADPVAYLWLTGQILGVAFGAGLLIEEVRERATYTPRQIRDLNTSIGLSHSLFEDTIILASIGASLFWIIVPRILLAALAVRVLRPVPAALRTLAPNPTGPVPRKGK